MKKLILFTGSLIVAVLASNRAHAAGDCQYRFSQSTGELKVVPAGFTGLMTCNATDTKKLLSAVVDAVSKQLDLEKGSTGMVPTVAVQIGNLSFFPALRAEIAKTLHADANWDKKNGKSKADSMNDPVATAFLRSSFVQDLSKDGLIVDEAGIETIKTVPAKELKVPGIHSGLYPEAGVLKLVFHKEAPHPSPSPFKKKERYENKPKPSSGTSATDVFPDTQEDPGGSD